MDIAESQLVVKMLALFKNRENADVSLVCEGKTILAHSTILELRWYSQGVWCCGVCILRIKWTFKSPLQNLFLVRSEYFKTALNTAVGGEKSTIEVEECSFKVLSAIIGFMYGKILAGENLDWEEATTLLPLADFFLMDDLEDAAIPVIENLLSLDNILEAAELAVKYSNEKLKEVCCDFALSRIPPRDQSNELLQKLILILPMFGLRAWHRSYVATKVLSVEPFQEQEEFSLRQQLLRLNLQTPET